MRQPDGGWRWNLRAAPQRGAHRGEVTGSESDHGRGSPAGTGKLGEDLVELIVVLDQAQVAGRAERDEVRPGDAPGHEFTGIRDGRLVLVADDDERRDRDGREASGL